jgi:hypothetical protein
MKQKIEEFEAFKVNGFIMLAIVGAIVLIGLWYLVNHLPGLSTLITQGQKIGEWVGDESTAEIGAWLAATFIAIAIPSLSGFFSIEPNQAAVLVLFGKYMGTVREAGLGNSPPISRQTLT